MAKPPSRWRTMQTLKGINKGMYRVGMKKSEASCLDSGVGKAAAKEFAKTVNCGDPKRLPRNMRVASKEQRDAVTTRLGVPTALLVSFIVLMHAAADSPQVHAAAADSEPMLDASTLPMAVVDEAQWSAAAGDAERQWPAVLWVSIPAAFVPLPALLAARLGQLALAMYCCLPHVQRGAAINITRCGMAGSRWSSNCAKNGWAGVGTYSTATYLASDRGFPKLPAEVPAPTDYPRSRAEAEALNRVLAWWQWQCVRLTLSGLHTRIPEMAAHPDLCSAIVSLVTAPFTTRSYTMNAEIVPHPDPQDLGKGPTSIVQWFNLGDALGGFFTAPGLHIGINPTGLGAIVCLNTATVLHGTLPPAEGMDTTHGVRIGSAMQINWRAAASASSLCTEMEEFDEAAAAGVMCLSRKIRGFFDYRQREGTVTYDSFHQWGLGTDLCPELEADCPWQPPPA